MKALKIIVAIFLWLCWVPASAQSEILNHEWIVKRVSRDTLLLLDQASENNSTVIKRYLEKPCEFQDTIYHLVLAKDNTLSVLSIVRSCSNGWNKKSNQKSDSSETDTGAVILNYESLNLNPKEVRMSLWDKTESRYEMKRSFISITGTAKFDGRYRIKVIDSGLIKLISAEKN